MNDGPPRYYGGLSPVALTEYIDTEIAYTKFLRLQNQRPYDCYTNMFGQVFCAFSVVQNSTVGNPDYTAVAVNDLQGNTWAGWYSLGACTRIHEGIHVTPWSCIPTVAVGTMDTSRSPYFK